MRTRLLKYPCSYLIYSAAFDALPKLIKSTIYTRLADVLSGKDTSADFQGLKPETRLAVTEILLDTKPAFAEFWKQSGNVAVSK